MDADKIVAQPGTITGSIGVFGGKMVTADFWAKLGVNWETVVPGQERHAVQHGLRLHPGAAARKNEALLDRIYVDFTQKAAAGRKLPLEQLQAVAQGPGVDGRGRAGPRSWWTSWAASPRRWSWPRRPAKLPKDAEVHVQVFPRKKQPAEVIAELLGGRRGRQQ